MFIALCALIVPHTLECCAVRGRAGEYFHGGESIWQDAMELLVAIGILRAVPNGPHQLCMKSGKIDAHTRQLHLDGPELLDTALAVFVGIFCDHGLPTTRRPFAMPPELSTLAACLSEAGYLDPEEHLWTWTQRILPAMVENHLWSSDGLCLEDAFQVEIAALAERILQLVPKELWEVLLATERPEDLEMLLFTASPHHGTRRRYRLGNWWDRRHDPELSAMEFNDYWQTPLIERLAREIAARRLPN